MSSAQCQDAPSVANRPFQAAAWHSDDYCTLNGFDERGMRGIGHFPGSKYVAVRLIASVAKTGILKGQGANIQRKLPEVM